jgi:hypothetical protein
VRRRDLAATGPAPPAERGAVPMHVGNHDAPRRVAFGHPPDRPGRSSGNRAAFTRARGDTCGRFVRAIGSGRPSGHASRTGRRSLACPLRKERLAIPQPGRAMASVDHRQVDRSWEWIRGGPRALLSRHSARKKRDSRVPAGLRLRQRRGHPNGAGFQHGMRSNEDCQRQEGTRPREGHGSSGR